MTPSTRVSAINIVGDLLRKVGVSTNLLVVVTVVIIVVIILVIIETSKL